MKHKPNIDFFEFRNKVVPQMKASTRGLCEVRIALGNALRQVPRLPGSRVLIQDFEWEEWLLEIDLPNDRNVYDWYKKNGDPKDVSNFVSALQNNGKGSKELSAALYYRLHYHVEKLDYAHDVDRKAFNGSTFEDVNSGVPVFERNDDSETALPPTFPSGIRLDDTYQKGRKEFLEAKAALLTKDANPVAVKAAVQGAGGYGKTALAEEICLDEGIRDAFSGGIYWLQFSLVGQRPEQQEKGRATTFADSVNDMLANQYSPEQGRIIERYNDEVALKSLFEGLPEKPMLIVADDLWTEGQANWISDLPEHVSVLATTRVKTLKSKFSSTFEIQRLSADASFELLTDKLVDLSDTHLRRLRSVSDAFGGWPLLLRLANATFKFQQSSGTRIDDTISEFEEFTQLGEVTGRDSFETGASADEARRKFVGHCIDAGIAAIPEAQYRMALLSMGVFPDDTDIPFSVIADYWLELTIGGQASEEIDEITGNKIRGVLNNLSFFRDYNSETKTLQIHDVFLAYFRMSFTSEKLLELRKKLVDSICSRCSDGWASLPTNQTYSWKYLLIHLEQAGQKDVADNLRIDFEWLKSKLLSSGVASLLSCFNFDNDHGRIEIEHLRSNSARSCAKDTDEPLISAIQQMGAALRMSQRALEQRPSTFALQIFGRLGNFLTGPLAAAVNAAKKDDEFWPRPMQPHLLSKRRVVENLVSEDYMSEYLAPRRVDVRCLAMSPAGNLVVSMSGDGLVKMWDINGDLKRSLQSHAGSIGPMVQFSENGSIFSTKCIEHSLQLWDSQSGDEIELDLVLNNEIQNKIAMSQQGNRIAAIGEGQVVLIYDISEPTHPGLSLLPHEGEVRFACFNPEGTKIVTSSYDGLIRISDTKSGQEICKWSCGKNNFVRSASFSALGDRLALLYTSGDVEVRDVSIGSETVRYFSKDAKRFNEVRFCTSGGTVAATSNIGACVWDLGSAKDVTPEIDGSYGWVIISREEAESYQPNDEAEKSLIWEVDPITCEKVFSRGRNPSEWIDDVAFEESERFVLASCHDEIARIWNAKSWEIVSEIGFLYPVTAVTMNKDYAAVGLADGAVHVLQL